MQKIDIKALMHVKACKDRLTLHQYRNIARSGVSR